MLAAVAPATKVYLNTVFARLTLANCPGACISSALQLGGLMSRFAVRDRKGQGLPQEGQDAAVSSPPDCFAKDTIENSDPDSTQALAGQLREAMARKGWSIGETARQASRYLADGQRLGRPQVWHYMWGHAPPRPHHLKALAQAFGRPSVDARWT